LVATVGVATPEAFTAGLVQKIFDGLVPRLSDSNSKINVQALEALQVVLPRLPRAELSAVTQPLVVALATNLAANNASVRALSEDALHALVTLAPREDLLAPFASQILYGKPAIRATLVMALAELVADAPAVAGGAGTAAVTPPASKTFGPALAKHILPLLPLLVDDAKLETKRSLGALMQALHRCMGNAVFSAPALAKLPASQFKKLEEMVV
jgi:hypothetical protein